MIAQNFLGVQKNVSSPCVFSQACVSYGAWITAAISIFLYVLKVHMSNENIILG